MHIILGLAGLAATLVATRNHMPTGFTGFFHPAAFILLLGAPPVDPARGPRPVGRVAAASSCWPGRCATTPRRAEARNGRRPLPLRARAETGTQRRGVEGARRGATIRCCARSGRCCCSRAAALTRARPCSPCRTRGWPRSRRPKRCFASWPARRPRCGLMGTIVGLVNMLHEPAQLRAAGAGDGGRPARDVLRADPGVRDLGAVRQPHRQLRPQRCR